MNKLSDGQRNWRVELASRQRKIVDFQLRETGKIMKIIAILASASIAACLAGCVINALSVTTASRSVR
jgi:hypothetical protein